MVSASFSRLFATLALVASVFPSVSAHGQLKGVSVNGQWYSAPNIYFDGDAVNSNTPIRKGYRSDSPSYVLQQDFGNDAKMACEEASGAPAHIPLKAGDTVSITWAGATTELQNAGFGDQAWVHAMGPVSDYIAECTNGDCSTFDAASAGWSKLGMSGLDPSGSISQKLRDAMNNKPEPYRSNGLWGMAQMVESGSTWNVQIPSSLKKGRYMLRNELIAVHNPLKDGDSTSGPQLYAGCIQIEVTDGGSDSLPAGTKAGSLYAPWGDLAWYSVFNSPSSFTNPGPAVLSLVTGGASNSGSSSTPSQPPSNNDNNNNNSGNNNSGSNSDNNNNNNSGSNSDNTQSGNNDNSGNNNSGNTDSGNNSGNNDSGNNDSGNAATSTSTTEQQPTQQPTSTSSEAAATSSAASPPQCRKRRRSIEGRSASKMRRHKRHAH